MMNDLLDWVAIAAACLMGAAMLVAGWEHLAREAADATRAPHPGLAAVAAVDVSLETLAETSAEGNASHTAMAAALTRAAANRPPRDSSPWLDTCPQVTMGVGEPAETAPELKPAAVVVAAPAPTPVPVPLPLSAPAPTAALAPQSTIERAALR